MLIKTRKLREQLRRISAFVLAFVLTLGTMSALPAGMFVKKVKAEEPVVYTLDITKDGNILDGEVDQGIWTVVSADTSWKYTNTTRRLQSNGVFAYYGDTLASGNAKVIVAPGQYIQLDGSVSSSGKAAIEINVPNDKNYTLKMNWSGKSASDSTLKWLKKDSSSFTTEAEQVTNIDTKKDFEMTLEAGQTYLIGAQGGMRIYSMSITQILGDKVSADIKYDENKIFGIESIYKDGALGEITASESQVIFTETPDAGKLTIAPAANNVYSGTGSFTVSLDTENKKIIVKNGQTVLSQIPYVVDGYLNSIAKNNSEEFKFMENNADKDVFGKTTVTTPVTTSPAGFITLSKGDNESLICKANHGLYFTKDIIFTVKVPAEARADFEIDNCEFSNASAIEWYADGDEANKETITPDNKSSNIDKTYTAVYNNKTNAEILLKIKVSTSGDAYIHRVKYSVSDIFNTVTGTAGTAVAGKTLKFTSAGYTATAVISQEGDYSVELKKGYKYTIELTDSATYEVDDDIDLTNVELGANVTKNITASAIPVVVKHPEKATALPQVTSFGSGELVVKELGQTLVLTQKGGSLVTQKIENSNISLYAFPATTGVNSIEADVVVTKESSPSNNRFIGLGVIKDLGVNADPNRFVACTTAIRNNKDIVMLYSKKIKEVLGKSGNTAVSATEEEKLHLIVKKTNEGVYFEAVNSSGNSNPKTMKYADLKYSDGSKLNWITGQSDEVQFGFILAGVTATITNMIYKDANGNVIYDQNTYYDPMGSVPVATSVTAAASGDRTKITVSWEGDKPKYDGKYVLQVLKPGTTDWITVSDAIKEKSYDYELVPGEGGNYKFRVCGTLGNSAALNESNRNSWVTSNVEYVEPALYSPEVTLGYVSSASKVNLSWNAVEMATKYEVYRRKSYESTATKIATVTETAYSDTTVEAEVPYYYSVKALSDNNQSVIKQEYWTLPSDGHSGNYDEDIPLYVTKRSYNTVFNNKISIEGVAGAAGKVSVYVNGTKKDTQAIANVYDTFAFNDIAIENGRNEVKLVLEYGDGLKIEKSLNYVNLTNYTIVVDDDFNGTAGDTQQYGVPQYKTVAEAINAATANDVIFVRNGDYEEKITVNTADISIIGEDSEKTRIYYNVAENVGVSGEARYTFTVKANNFTMENIKIESTYPYKGDGSISNESAEVFFAQADNVMLVGVGLYGYQDTLQVKTYKYYFVRCYILGNVDFMWGQNCKAIFDDCDIEFRYSEKKNSGYYTAFETAKDATYGVVYKNCRFTAEPGCGGTKYYLGRPYNNKAAVSFLNCYMGSIINRDFGYSDWSGNELSKNEDVYRDTRYFECGSYGPGYYVNINRRQVSEAEINSWISDDEASWNTKMTALNDKYVGTKTTAPATGTVENVFNTDKYSPQEGNDSGLAKYNAEGYAATKNVTGGGLLKETNTNYIKVATGNEFLDALAKAKAKKGTPMVIELTADINLGYNEIDNVESYGASLIAKHNEPKISPVLKESGISKVYIQNTSNLTIYSKNGYSIKHAALTIKSSSNIMIRNIKFDELWEWDEETKGDYDVNDWDYLTIEYDSSGIWIDHCTFYKSYDGVIDIKTDSTHTNPITVTISWCEFLPGSENNEFFNEIMNMLDKDPDSYPYYKSLLDDGMTKAQIWSYAYGQKKTHLLGQDDGITANECLRVTFANNYYYNSMDRMPRMRFGTAHMYNCVISAQELLETRLSIKNEDVAKHIVSNGASSTCGGHVLLDSCLISGVTNALNSGNGSSPAGYINAINSDYFINGIKSKLEVINNNSQKDGALIQDPDEFIAALPYNYSYTTYDSASLEDLVIPYTGAGKLKLTTLQWEKSSYNDNEPIKTTTNVKSEIGEGAPDTQLAGSFDELKNKIFTEAELELIKNGATAQIILNVNKIEKLEEKDNAAVELKIISLSNEKDKFKFGMALDLGLKKSVGSATSVVTKTNGNLEIVISLPTELIPADNIDRKFKIVRIHDDEVAVLDAKFDKENGTITFETDRFSVYAIIYADNAVATGDSSQPWTYVIMMTIAVGMFFTLWMRRRFEMRPAYETISSEDSDNSKKSIKKTLRDTAVNVIAKVIVVFRRISK